MPILQMLLRPRGLTLAVAPAAMNGTASGLPASGVVNSNTVTVTATGGSGGTKTYAWTIFSGTSVTFASPTNATTGVNATCASGVPKTGVARCTVSDGTFTATIDVPYSLEWSSTA